MVCKTGKNVILYAVSRIRRVCRTAALTLVFLGCASSPNPGQWYADRADDFALMAPGADLYLAAEVQQSRPILDNLVLGNMGGKEIAGFLDMSSSLTAALYTGRSPRHFMLAANGRYPSTRGGMFFSASKDWEKAKSASKIPYWRSAKSNLSVYLNASRAYISDGDPFSEPPGAESPSALAALKKDAVFSGWMNNPGTALGRILAALGVPIQIPAERLVFGVYRESNTGKSTEENAYHALLRLETPHRTQAAALLRIFTLARAAAALMDFSAPEEAGRGDLASLAAVFFANNPGQDDNALILATGTMSGRELALLFNTLSVYF